MVNSSLQYPFLTECLEVTRVTDILYFYLVIAIKKAMTS